MARECLSANSEPNHPLKTTQSIETTRRGQQNHACGSVNQPFGDQDRMITDSSKPLKDESYPYTTEFFSAMAEAVALTFPFDAFARRHGCKVEDVFRAVNATIVEPLSKPSILPGMGKAQLETGLPPAVRNREAIEPSGAAGAANNKPAPTKSTNADLTLSRSPESGRGAKLPVSMSSESKKKGRRYYSKSFLERLLQESRAMPMGQSHKIPDFEDHLP
ncbi:hypothetical protein BDW59DRAFT_164575 [Aspergillus cavernicola]|uniref:Uncharacterized protein n=1 Tax=Aspergillus cavernicola TaxID=176166 RepID=A0ABR4HYH0_9EURO